MVRDQQKFPRLNLARLGAVHLVVYGTYENSEERRKLLPERTRRSTTGRPERAILSVARYTTRGTLQASYQILANSHAHDEEDEIHFTIEYREHEGSPMRRPSNWESEQTFLSTIQEMGIPQDAAGRVLFRFVNREPNQLWFPLPVNLAGNSPEDTIEIRGVRGAKLSNGAGDPDYEFILDLPNDEEVLLSVELKIEEPITPTVVQATIRRASAIARELVQAPSAENARGTTR